MTETVCLSRRLSLNKERFLKTLKIYLDQVAKEPI